MNYYVHISALREPRAKAPLTAYFAAYLPDCVDVYRVTGTVLLHNDDGQSVILKNYTVHEAVDVEMHIEKYIDQNGFLIIFVPDPSEDLRFRALRQNVLTMFAFDELTDDMRHYIARTSPEYAELIN